MRLLAVAAIGLAVGSAKPGQEFDHQDLHHSTSIADLLKEGSVTLVSEEDQAAFEAGTLELPEIPKPAAAQPVAPDPELAQRCANMETELEETHEELRVAKDRIKELETALEEALKPPVQQ